VDEIYRLAVTLRERDGDPAEKVTFTHCRTTAAPAQVLTRLRDSTVGDLLVPEHALITHPTHHWLTPVAPVHASMKTLLAAGVTASTWEPPDWDFVAAELTAWLRYEEGGARAQQRLSLTSWTTGITLTRFLYDEQRAETGYEGGDRLSIEPTQTQIADFLTVVSWATRGS
jgi:hypothetical protein